MLGIFGSQGMNMECSCKNDERHFGIIYNLPPGMSKECV